METFQERKRGSASESGAGGAEENLNFACLHNSGPAVAAAAARRKFLTFHFTSREA